MSYSSTFENRLQKPKNFIQPSICFATCCHVIRAELSRTYCGFIVKLFERKNKAIEVLDKNSNFSFFFRQYYKKVPT